MREEIERIIKMVEEGRLSAAEASDLIEAIRESEPKPGEERDTVGAGARKDAFNTFFESVDRATRDAMERVNWPEISQKIREATRTGWEKLRTDMEQMGKGDWKNIFGRHSEHKEQELPLSIGPGATLHVEVASGDVKVVGGAAEPKIKASAEIRGKDEEEMRQRVAAWALMLDQTGNDVTVRLPGQSAGTASVDLEVHLPEGVALEMKSASGDVEIEGTLAAVRLISSSGDVKVVRAADRVSVQSNSGDIAIRDFEGSMVTVESKSGDICVDKSRGGLNIRTASGDLSLQDITGPTIMLETISGDIGVKFSEGLSTNCNLRSVSGDIEVQVPDGSSCRVSLSSLSGEVSCGVVLKDELRSERRITGMCGDGHGALDASAISGTVNLELRSYN